MTDESLESFVERVNGTSHLRIEYDFGDGFVRLQTSEAERRQAIQDIRTSENIVLELLRNARDAHASQIFIATSKEQNKRLITVIDNGDGIPASMHEHIFEPRVTSKLDSSHLDKWGYHGRGMALYSISVNAESAYVVDSAPNLGSALAVEVDTKKLGEKSDQSSFPRFVMEESGEVSVRGPRNILRTACEFALEERANCTVRVGTATEIAAALYEYGSSSLSAVERAFCSDISQVALCKRLALAASPEEFAALAYQLGLPLSERSARRILDGEIPAAVSLLDRVTVEKEGRSISPKPLKHQTTGTERVLSLDGEDAEMFAEDVKNAFKTIAERYYLEDDVEPEVKVRGATLSVSIPLVKNS